MTPTINEIAPDLYRISVYVPDFDLQFNHFLIKDEESMLYHTGMRKMFPFLQESVKKILDPAEIRWIGGSHFEVDEWGALNEWLEVAPNAQPICSEVGALINLSDFANRPPRGLKKDEVLNTGKYKFRFRPTPHLPHGWDAGVLFEETNKTLLCSDLFHQTGNVEARTESDVIGRTRQALIDYQAGVLMDYFPYTPKTKQLLHELAELKPTTLAIMHGSSYAGDGEQALRDLAVVMKEVYGEKELRKTGH